jgi:hypothetical protein
MKTALMRHDLISLEEFSLLRDRKRKEMMEFKKSRRVYMDNDVVILFENYDTLWWQIQEMLYIEKGGDEQVQDELAAYSPLVPKGQELVATLMIEIEDPGRRSKVLNELGGIEKCLSLEFADHTVNALPEEDVSRTTETGKTSSVHFIRWPFLPRQINSFSNLHQHIVLKINHPKLQTEKQMPENVRASLVDDFRKN